MKSRTQSIVRNAIILFLLLYLVQGKELFGQDVNLIPDDNLIKRSLARNPGQEGNINSFGITTQSLTFRPENFQKWGNIKSPGDDPDLNYKTWESEKHFWIAVGELAIVEFIPWALARWIREWEDPSKNWAVVGSNTWWRNINNGWEYDGDNFVTNFFAHPYHGNLFFNTGRTNGYNFWESTAFAFTGSAVWEYFGETYRPAFNDWINTSLNGINLGEITYRLSTMVTDNSASGSERLWSEIFGTLINPVRGFNRLVSGEMSKSFPNPEWRKPEDFNLFLSSGMRRLDKNGSELVKDGVEEGIFGLDLNYGNPLKAVEPFSNFRITMVIASGLPRLNRLESSGYLAGITLKNSETVKHKFDINLEYSYNNIYKQDTADSTKYEGILLGATSVYPHILSYFKVWENSKIITEIGINGVLMGATPDDYYYDVEGRNYDFGPGVGMRLVAVLNSGIWNYIKLVYNGIWIWTMSEPAESTHHIHNLSLELQFPLNNYFAFGIGGNIYWRNSYYTNYEDVYKEHPAVKVFFTTALL
jgi:hypothetical protein